MEIKRLDKSYILQNKDFLNEKLALFFKNYDVAKQPNHIVFFQILYKGKFAGMFNIFLKNRIQKFFIMPEFQSKGLGSMAVKKIIDHNLKGLHCYVRKNNKKAISFWQKNGFIIEEDLDTIFKMIYNSKVNNCL